MSLDERVSRLIGQIYAGIQDAEVWDATMAEFVAVTGVRWALSSVTDIEHHRHDRLGWHGPTGETRFATGIEEFEGGETVANPTLIWAAQNPGARFGDSREILAGADYTAHPFVRWDKARFGTDHWLCGFTPPSSGLSFAISINPLEGPVSDHQARLFRLLFEHAENAAALYIRPPWIGDTRDPCLLVDRGGRMVWWNEAADRLLSRNPALGGKVACSRRVIRSPMPRSPAQSGMPDCASRTAMRTKSSAFP